MSIYEDCIDEEFPVEDHSTKNYLPETISNEASKDEEEAKREILAKEEQRILRLLRWATLSILLVVAIFMCLAIIFYLRVQESKSLDQAFNEQATKVLKTFQNHLAERISAIDYFSLNLISHSISMNIEWPKMYVPHFEVRGNRTNLLAATISISVLPIVNNDSRQTYETFSNMMQGWVPEGLAFQEWWNDSSWSNPDDWKEQVGRIPPTITSMNPAGERVNATGEGPFLPKWQSAPALRDTSTVSLDLLSNPTYEPVLRAGLESGRVLFGKSFLPYENDEEEASSTSDQYAILKQYLERWQEAGNEYTNDAVTDLVYPLYDDFFGKPNLVGLVHSHVYWRNYFTDSLPDGDGPLIAILENSCGQEFAFAVDGSETIYHGSETSLARSNDATLSLSASFSDMAEMFAVAETVAGECSYTLHLHASMDMESQYKTNDPRNFTLIISGVFIFTSIVFLFYDFLVERRQKKVMSQALRSGTLVSQLFPKAVRERMYEEEQRSDNRNEDSFEKKDRDTKHGLINEEQSHILSSDPVADLYTNCTVLFADVVGFTEWSANQQPTAVFKLLETLYYNFDRIARHHKVFKVETIGDCYVAVTGLPEKQAQHAIIMARFAQACMKKMFEVLPALNESLGGGVADLSMRVGLHSGPVTAGVLRGDRARFQLFGDTVNTAARMESNGSKGRIHISGSTANLLRESLLSYQITMRAEKIVAKGKGEMQTYWLDTGRSASSVSSGSSTRMLSHSGTNPSSDLHDDIERRLLKRLASGRNLAEGK